MVENVFSDDKQDFVEGRDLLTEIQILPATLFAKFFIETFAEISRIFENQFQTQTVVLRILYKNRNAHSIRVCSTNVIKQGLEMIFCRGLEGKRPYEENQYIFCRRKVIRTGRNLIFIVVTSLPPPPASHRFYEFFRLPSPHPFSLYQLCGTRVLVYS